MSLDLVTLGPPGAGKGTQAERFARVRGIPKISTGDILREAVAAGTPVGRLAQATMARGELVSDDVMIEIVRDRLSRPDARGGFVLDGFPRTVVQAEALDRMLAGRRPLIIVDIVVPLAELVRRLSSRWICADCGTTLPDMAGGAGAQKMVTTGPGSTTAESVAAVLSQTAADRCPRCGGALVKRQDDNSSVVLDRLNVYDAQTRPLVDYYRVRPTFRSVNGAQPPERVASDLATAVESAAGSAQGSVAS